MKCSKTYILASVSLAVALMTSSAMAAPKGNFKFNGSANRARSLQSNSFNRSNAPKSNASGNVLRSSQANTVQTRNKFTANGNQFKKLNSNVVRGLPKTTVLNPSVVSKINRGKVGGTLINKGNLPALNPSNGSGRPPIGPIGPVVGPAKPPVGPFTPLPPGTRRPPIGPIGPVVGPAKPPVGPFTPLPPGTRPVGPIVDPGKYPWPYPPIGPKPPVDPAPPVDPPYCPPADPPYCPPYDPPYCGGGSGFPLPFPFPFPVGGGCGGGFGGGTTVVDPPYAPMSPAVESVVEQTAELPVDLELLEVRQLDRGDQAKNLGPAYRLTLRNKSGLVVAQPFSVVLAASIGRQPTAESAFAAERVEGLIAGETLSVEVRLPTKAYNMGLNADGQPVPFSWLTAVVDIDQEVPQVDRDNDLTVLNRSEVVMVAQK